MMGMLGPLLTSLGLDEAEVNRIKERLLNALTLIEDNNRMLKKLTKEK